MIGQQSKADHFAGLFRILEEQLEWIINREYTQEAAYRSVQEMIASLPGKSEDEMVEGARSLGVSFQELSVSIGERIKSMIDLSFGEVHHIRDRIAQIQQEKHSLRDKIQSLQDTRQHLMDKIAHWEKEYDILKAEAIEMQSKFEDDLRVAKKEKKQLRRTFLQVQEETEEERKLYESMQMEQNVINEKMTEEKREKEEMLQEISALRRKLQSFENRTKSTEGKVIYSQKKIAQLQQQISEKNSIIEEYYQSQRPKVKLFDGKDIDLISVVRNQQGINEKNIKRLSEIDSKKLADQLNLNSEEFQIQRTKSLRNSIASVSLSEGANQDFQGINKSIIEEEEMEDMEESRMKEPALMPDLYFAHYLLTVQSVKLKLGREELFSVDMGGRYPQLVASGVPFHMWDQWIKEKVNEVKRK